MSSEQRTANPKQLPLGGQEGPDEIILAAASPWVSVPITNKVPAPMKPSALVASLKAGKIPWSSGYIFGSLGKKK
jgi:hypothetical protein